MRSRSLITLALATIVAVVAAAASVYVRQSQARLPEMSGLLFPGLVDQVNDVATLQIVSPEGTYTIARKSGEDWAMKEKYGYPVRFETVKQAVVGVASLKPLEAKTAKPDRFHKIRVNDPTKDAKAPGLGTLVRLVDDKGGEIAAVVIGKTRSVKTTDREGWYYVREAGEAQTWLASGRVEAHENFDRWLDSEMVTVARDRMRAASTIQADGATVNISRPSPEQTDFNLDEIPEDAKLIHETIPNSLGSALGFVTFEDVKPASELDFANVGKAIFRTFDGLVVTVDVIPDGEKAWIRYSAAFDEDGIRLEQVPETRKKRMKNAEAVKQEVERINTRFGSWTYRVAKFKADDLTMQISDMVHFPKPEDSDDK